MADRGRIAAEMNEAAKQERRKITEKCKEKGYMQRSKGDLTDQSFTSPSNSSITPAEEHLVYQNRLNGGR